MIFLIKMIPVLSLRGTKQSRISRATLPIRDCFVPRNDKTLIKLALVCDECIYGLAIVSPEEASQTRDHLKHSSQTSASKAEPLIFRKLINFKGTQEGYAVFLIKMIIAMHNPLFHCEVRSNREL